MKINPLRLSHLVVLSMLPLMSLHSYSADPEYDQAVQDWNSEKVMELIKGGIPADTPVLCKVGGSQIHGATALIVAVTKGDVDAVDDLIKAGADVHAKADMKNSDGSQIHGITALFLAATMGEVDIVDELIKAGADVHVRMGVKNSRIESSNWPLLLSAIESGNLTVIEALLEAGADANVPVDFTADDVEMIHWTPLMVAVSMDHVPAAIALLGAGANLRTKSTIKGADKEQSLTPLEMADALDNPEMMALLRVSALHQEN